MCTFKKLFSILLLLGGKICFGQSIWPEAGTVSPTVSITFPNLEVTAPATSISITPVITTTVGNIEKHFWVQTSNNKSVFVKKEGETTKVTGLKPGYTVVRLYVRKGELGKKDTIFWKEAVIKVHHNSNAVSINSGNDSTVWKHQTVDIGNEKIKLVGEYSNGAKTFLWQNISGPNKPLIANKEAATTLVSNIQLGTYQFKLTINKGTSTEQSQIRTVHFKDAQEISTAPCRPGGGLKYWIPASDSGTYIGANGAKKTWNKWKYLLDFKKYVKAKTGMEIMGGDTLLFQGADSTAEFHLNNFGGNKGCPVVLQPVVKPIIIKGFAKGTSAGYFRLGTVSTVAQDTVAVAHVIVDGTSLRPKFWWGWQMDNSDKLDVALNATHNTQSDGSLLQSASNSDYDSVLNKTAPAFIGSAVTDLTIKGYYARGAAWLQIKKDSKASGPFMYNKYVNKNIKILDCFLREISEEGMYLGSTNADGTKDGGYYLPPVRMDSVQIIGNLVWQTNWDGIQLSNSMSGNIVKHNIVIDAGRDKRSSQKAGIIGLGGNASGVIDSNFVFKTTGNGIEVFGKGDVYVRGNVVDSTGARSLYQRSTPLFPEKDLPITPFTVGNIWSRWKISAMWQNKGFRMNVGETVENTFVDKAASDVTELIDSDKIKHLLKGNKIIDAFPIQINAITNNKSTGWTISITQGKDKKSFTSSAAALVRWLHQQSAKQMPLL